MNLQSKNVLFAGWGAENPQDTYMYQIYYLLLKKIFPKMDSFDTKKEYFQLGKDKMNLNFLKKVQSKKYDLIISAQEYDEFYPETLKKIRELSPESKSMMIICDDDAKFDSWSRYLSLFFDYTITSQDYVKNYKQEGINIFFHYDYNTYKLGPLNIEKKYDVTFIGRPKADRNEVIKYLLDNGIKVTLFGWDWYKYPEFKDVYGGPLSQEDYAKVINQSKINLSPTKAGYLEQRNQFNMKGRFYEVSLCKSFQLVEKFPTLLKFFNEKEMGMYISQEDMLDKIKYYLKNEKERETIAERAYKKTITLYNREKQLIQIFTEVLKSNEKKTLPSSNKKIVSLKKKELFMDEEKLKEKLRNADYISFDINAKSSDLKEYFLSRALNVTAKNIACCDYYVSSLGIKDYMVFISKFAFKRIGKEACKLIDINQLMAKKDFFLQNIQEFKKIAEGEYSELIKEESTAFVSIPLVSIKHVKKIEYDKMKKAFEMKFPNELFALIHQKKILINPYPYFLTMKSLFANPFILKYLIEMIKDKGNLDKLSVNKQYMEKSVFKKITK
jgi:spore maturation protein CgeB